MKYENIFNLKDRIAVVTGAAGLIGRELARVLSEFGATVYIAEFDENKGKALEGELTKDGLSAVYNFLDITEEKSVTSLIENIDKKHNRLDVWVNNAYPRTKDWGLRFEDIPVESWKKNIDMHLNGYFICCQKAAEYMKKRKKGSIINFGSTYGINAPDFTVYKGTEMTSPGAYSAIKGGIINFTKYLASYYGKHNVRVNSISPGGVFDNQDKTFVGQYTDKIPLKRMASNRDMAGGVLFLASDASEYVTGHNLVVDGGWSSV